MRPLIITVCVFLISAQINLTALAQTESKGQKYALVIGVKGYPSFPEDEKLLYSDSDARSFYDFILSPVGGDFPSSNVRLLLNADATRAAVLREISWLSNRVGNNDLVYVFLAGHGVVDGYGRAYLMPYDADKNNPTDRGIRADGFLEEIRTGINAKYVVLFIDACHSGAAITQGGSARDANPNVTVELKDRWEAVFNKQESISMGFFSASSNQRSWEDTDLRQGLFTYFLIKGLKGAADRNQDNKVTAGEIHRYVLDNVSDRAERKFRSPQTPISSPKFESEFPLSIIPTQVAPKEIRAVTIRIPTVNTIQPAPKGLVRTADGKLRPASGYAWIDASDPNDLRVQLMPGLIENAAGMLEPASEYVWVNASDPEDRRVQAMPGLIREAGKFKLASGYVWVNTSDPKDLRVQLMPGLIREAGKFKLASGYVWVNASDPNDLRVQLMPGLIKNAAGTLEPASEYIWVNASDPEDRRVQAMPGLIREAGKFRLASGYVWVNTSDPKDLRVQLMPGLIREAGKFKVASGYVWVNASDPNDLRVQLMPGLISEAGKFKVASGYVWVNASDQNDLRVQLMPGLIKNPDGSFSCEKGYRWVNPSDPNDRRVVPID